MSVEADRPPPTSELILYRTEDSRTRIEVRIGGDSVWLTQVQMASLYQVSAKTVSEHLGNVFDDGECEPERTVRKFRTVQVEGGREVRRLLDHYSLEAILAVGFRVRSPRGTQFRQWASERLQEYLVKGFALDDERLKRGSRDGYYEELYARIRDIRSSEREFWRKVLDIYATSVDYDPSAEASQRFFKIVQNKMHWAAHGHTAAEIVLTRADASRPNAGMTSFTASRPRKLDAGIAKNYLAVQELDALNKIVTAYLDFAEVQALNRRPMTMADWIAKLDEFLRLGEREVLTHAGSVSYEVALAHAERQFELYQAQQARLPTAVDEAFDQATRKLKQLAASPRKRAEKKNR